MESLLNIFKILQVSN